MYLYGLDLSLSCSGVTVFDLKTLQPVFITSIETDEKQTHGKRLKFIVDSLAKIMQEYTPHVVAIERTFNRFPTATAALYKVHGVANCLFWKYEQVYYPPKEIKSVISSGNASKTLVRKKIEMVYPNVQFANEDESDSFAIALTWLIKDGRIEWSKGASVKGKGGAKRAKKSS